MNNNLLPIHFAPLQGYTDAVYRLAHARIFGGIDTYYSPFVRVEHGEIRRKDARDISSKNNREGIHLIPQLIASQPDKLEQIITLSSRTIIRKQISTWDALSQCWPNVTMAPECCRIRTR